MKRFGRAAMYLSLAVFALAAIVLIGLNLYVESQGTQERIQQELSQRLGTTLRIHRVTVTPWGGLTLTGITIPQGSAVAGPNDFLEAKSFHLHVRLLSLFSRKLVIKKVALLSPMVVWPQDADGKWRLPGGRKEAVGAATTEPEKTSPIAENDQAKLPPTAASTPVAMPSATEAPLAAAKPESASKHLAFVPEVRQVNVSGGTFRFLDRAGNMVATFEEVDFRSSLRNAVALRGSAEIGKVSLRDRFYLQHLRSPLHYDPKELNLSKISAHAGGGDIEGSFTVQPQAEDSPFSLSVKFRGVQADQIVADAGGPKNVVQGQLEGSLEANGKTGNPNVLAGQGEIFLRDGQLQQYSLLVALGQVLQIEELTQLHLNQAQAKYHISGGLITIDELLLRSPNVRLSATGTVTLNGKLRLDSQLAINEKIRSQLFKPIRANFQPSNEPGYSVVDFQVSGTIDRPKSNLVEKVVGRDLKEFVSGLFGGKKSDRPKKKKSADVSGGPAGESVSSPPPAESVPTATPTPASSTP